MTLRHQVLSAEFSRISELERAYHRLQDIGIPKQLLKLHVHDEIARREEREPGGLNRWLTMGECLGLMLGFVAGMGMFRPPGTPSSLSTMPIAWSLLILAAWAACGAMLGAMLGAICREAFVHESEGPAPFELEVRVPAELQAQALRILKHARVAEEWVDPNRVAQSPK